MDINKILATPLKLPRLEPDSWEKFWEVWQRDAKEYIRLAPDSQGNARSIPGWTGFVWELLPPEIAKWQTMWSVPTKDYSDEFPDLKAQLDALPCRVVRILFQSNHNNIGEHRDGMVFTDHLPYPAVLRYMFYDENVEPNFYFTKERGGSEVFLQLPPESNAFTYNNPKIFHAAKYFGKKKIVAHVVIDQIDEEKWFKLLEDSVNEWPNLAWIDG